jgi:hypothetical protein
MKTLYLSVAVFAVFQMALQCVITYVTSPEEATVARLERAPKDWRFYVNEDSGYFKKEDEEKLKKDVLGFFQHAGSPTYSKLDSIFNCLAIAFVFSAVGYWRELRLQ